jgi:Dolichyl-phosphate-mannose-protein mannosyltransferase
MSEADGSSRAQRRFGPTIVLAAWFSAVYLPATLLLASRKQLWNDELFTFYIARVPNFRDIWGALLTGAEQIPPAFYWITRVFLGNSADSHAAIRLPEILGFWLMGVCLIAIVSRRAPPAYGVVAALAPLFTGAYAYAFEARPYGVVLGLAGLALLCWQRAEARRGMFWTAGLGATLAAAVSMHYYAVLLLVPLAAAEAIHVWRLRRMRWSVWIALALGVSPLLFYLPLIRGARTYSGTFWARPGASSIAEFMTFLFGQSALPLAAVLVWAGVHVLVRWKAEKPPEGRPEVPLEEVAAVLGYMAFPVLAVVLGKAVTGAYTHRYALPAVIGVSVFGAWALSVVFGGRSRPALLIAALLSCVFFARVSWEFREISRTAAQQATMIGFLQNQTDASLPVVIADPHLFFELSHYAPRELADRLRYFADAKLAVRFVGTDTVDRGLLAMREWAPLHVEPFRPPATPGHAFLIYGHPAPFAWLVPELASLHVPMVVIDSVEDRLLLLAGPANGSYAGSVDAAGSSPGTRALR